LLVFIEFSVVGISTVKLILVRPDPGVSGEVVVNGMGSILWNIWEVIEEFLSSGKIGVSE